MALDSLGTLWTRIIAGDRLRKTRFHTYSGTLIDLGGLVYLPHAIWSVCLLRSFGYRLRVPWLGYRAVRKLRSLLRCDWSVLEFGSGMSSLILAQSCRHLVSVESDPHWYEEMRRLFAEYGLKGVDYRLRSQEEYAVHPDLLAHSFDLVLVDGLVRDQAAKVALKKVKPNGYVFLDNSDVPWLEYTSARRILLQAAEGNGVWFFNDLHPFQIQVNESMLIKVKGSAGVAA